MAGERAGRVSAGGGAGKSAAAAAASRATALVAAAGDSGVASRCGTVLLSADDAWLRAANAQAGRLGVAAELVARIRSALLTRLHVHGRGAAASALNAATARVLGTKPLRVHLFSAKDSAESDSFDEAAAVWAFGGDAASGKPLVIAAPCLESALAALCSAALSGGDISCLGAATAAFGAATRDALLGVSLQTGRSAVCGGGGAPPVRVRELNAAALLALPASAGAPLAQRALWAEALASGLLSGPSGGAAALLRLCRAPAPAPGSGEDLAAALDAAAAASLRPRGCSLAKALQAWARRALLAEAQPRQTGWLGGAGALSPAAAAYLAADPDAKVPWLNFSAPPTRDGVRPAKLRANLTWLAMLMIREKPADLTWCLAAVGFNAAWAIFAPLITSDVITIAPALAAWHADPAAQAAGPLEMTLLHGGLMPDYTVGTANGSAKRALAILASAFGAGAALAAYLNRQLSAKGLCNPGFALGARAALARRLAAAPGLLADTAALAEAARAAQHDALLVGSAASATFTAANAVGQLALALALMFCINARMAAFFIATLPVTALLTGVQGRASGELSAALKARQEELETAADAALLCAGDAAAVAHHDAEVAAAGAEAEAAADKIGIAAAVLQQYVAIVSGGLMAFLLGYGGLQMATGVLDVGLFVAFISAAGVASPQVPALVEAVRAWRVAGRAAALLRGGDCLRAAPAPALEADSKAGGADGDYAGAAPALAARAVVFAYNAAPLPALRHVSFELPPGTKCLLIGRSGSGKTTLLRLMAGRYEPSAGSMLADGAPLAAALRLRGVGAVAFAPAEPLLFAGTVNHNIRLGLPPSALSDPDGGAARVTAAAAAAGLTGAGALLASGMATRVAKTGLSTGQRQRIGVARALAADAPLLLLDEPTSAQDGTTAAALVAALAKLTRHAGGAAVTVVAATNAPALFEDGGFSYALCVADSTVAEAGPLAALKASRGAYARTASAVAAADVGGQLEPAALRAALWPLATASDAECALLAPLLAPRTLAAGTTLFAAGARPGAAFILARGRIALAPPPGAPAGTKASMVPLGACFQEASLADAAAVADRTATAIVADTVVLELRAAALAALAPLAPRPTSGANALLEARAAAAKPEALRAAAWPFARLDDEAMAALATAAVIEVTQPGDALMPRGGTCPGLGVVLSGEARVTLRNPDGAESTLSRGPGAAFGADAMLTGGIGGSDLAVVAGGSSPLVCLLLPAAAVLPPAAPPSSCSDVASFDRASAALGAAADAWRAACGAEALAQHWLVAAAVPNATERAEAAQALAAAMLPLPLGAPARLPPGCAPCAFIPVRDVDLSDCGDGSDACKPGDGAWGSLTDLAPGAPASAPAALNGGSDALAALLPRDSFLAALGAGSAAASRAAAAVAALGRARAALRAAGVAAGRVRALRRGADGVVFPHDSADDAAVLLCGGLADVDAAPGALLLRSPAARALLPASLAAALGAGASPAVAPDVTSHADEAATLFLFGLGSRPAATGAPKLTGVASLGDDAPLRVDTSAVSLPAKAERAEPSFAWSADNVPIPRAITPAYAPEPADVGKRLAVAVRAAPWVPPVVLSASERCGPSPDSMAEAEAALAAVSRRGSARFAVRLSFVRGGAAAVAGGPALHGADCVLDLSRTRVRLARAPEEQRGALAAALLGDGSVTLGAAAFGAKGLALAGARGEGFAPRAAYLQLSPQFHAMLLFDTPAERNGALSAARTLATRKKKPLPPL